MKKLFPQLIVFCLFLSCSLPGLVGCSDDAKKDPTDHPVPPDTTKTDTTKTDTTKTDTTKTK